MEVFSQSRSKLKRVGLDSGGEGSSTVYLELVKCPNNKKQEIEEMQFQSTFRSRISLARSATKKFFSRDAKFLSNRTTMIFFGIFPL